MNKYIFLWLSLSLLLLPLTLNAAKRDVMDLLTYRDAATGGDSTIIFTPQSNMNLQVKYLYTDSLQVGWSDVNGQTVWLEAEQVQFFRWDSRLYGPKIIEGTDGQQRRIFMDIDRNSKSKVRIYSMGMGRNRVHYAEGPDSVLRVIDNVHKFRTDERVRRTGNPKYYRHFRWGVMAGMVDTDAEFPQFFGASPSQIYATGGLWADLPIDPFGFSLHAGVYLHASSGSQSNEKRWSVAYNEKAVSLPVTLRYSLLPLKGDFTPYIEGGIDFRFVYDNSMVGISSLSDHDHETWTREGKNDSRQVFTLGAGLEYRLNDKHSVWLSGNYLLKSDYYKFGYSNTGTTDGTMKGWTLFVKYNF